MEEFEDKIFIKDLVVHTVLGVNSWERVENQPIIVNITIFANVTKVGETDFILPQSINYAFVCEKVQKFAAETSDYKSIEAFADGVAKICIVECNAPKVTLSVEKPRALLHASSAGVRITRTKQDYNLAKDSEDSASKLSSLSTVREKDTIFVKDLRLNAIIGVDPWEREEKQTVVFYLIIYPNVSISTFSQAHIPRSHNFITTVRTISKCVEESNYKTIEALAAAVAKVAIVECHVNKISVRAEKPSALTLANSAGVEITRSRADFYLPRLDSVKQNDIIASNIGYNHLVFIALGTNLDNTIDNINQALRALEIKGNCKVLDTSFLYETIPMYVTNQPRFLNAMCKAVTDLNPEALLQKLKAIEIDMGRFDNSTIRNGPRIIDLDIIFYDDIEYSSPTLKIPHPRITEREFVLRPLCDIAKEFEHPKLFRPCSRLLSQLLKSPDYVPEANNINKVIFIRETQWIWKSKTFIMGVLNVTPDSFSDGGLYNTIDKAVAQAEKLIADGADIIDIGGMSTRPGADEITAEEELSRVLPVIRAIREKGITDIPISIDTFRAAVAEKAIECGADFINDVSGGTRDPEMYSIMAKCNVPVCLQHMRGTPKTMGKLSNYDNVITDICRELGECVNSALKAGVKRWNIIIDPGIGFAKNYEQNFQILRKLPDIISEKSPLKGFPCLVGPSRKRFIGWANQQVEAQDRVWGTAAACTASISGGANILRVHDVTQMLEVVKVADKIWRKT
ncbi:1008_t:CDS:2 [Ambispora gerdemannii]|uniref:Folic acid synthesis protein FOL1 n=1 Tax=Ambispora gerdemannii TaxID=144530 RepID=A0A9N8W030_9GLOM|nr:1008_t:CDS:2 [Ambispora gerdemannii]